MWKLWVRLEVKGPQTPNDSTRKPPFHWAILPSWPAGLALAVLSSRWTQFLDVPGVFLFLCATFRSFKVRFGFGSVGHSHLLTTADTYKIETPVSWSVSQNNSDLGFIFVS